jgi:hypothetical protein
MARLHVVTVLEQKYARLLGQQAKAPDKALAATLAHIEAVIWLFEPDWSAASIKPVMPKAPSRWRRRGDGFRLALQVLREAECALSATEIATRALAISGRAAPSESDHRIIGTDLSYLLRLHLGAALVEIEGRPRRYSLGCMGDSGEPVCGCWNGSGTR